MHLDELICDIFLESMVHLDELLRIFFWKVGLILTNYFEIFLGGRVNLDKLL